MSRTWTVLLSQGLRQAMVTTETVTDFNTELYRLISIATNESDPWKVALMAERLTTHLDAMAPEIKAAAARVGTAAIEEKFAAYDWAARQMIEFTRRDAAYGVMMMGYAEEYFAQLRHVLTETSARAQEHRNKATADLLTGLTQMHMAFLM